VKYHETASPRDAAPGLIPDTDDTEEAPTMTAPADDPGTTHLSLLPWPDPVIDEMGHDPRSAYVERFWLGAIGPSCTWLLRRLAHGFDEEPEGFTLDVAEWARALGLGAGLGRHAPLGRTITRCCQFGLARRYGPDGLVVRRRMPPLARHQLARLPDGLQQEHDRFVADATHAAPGAVRQLPFAPRAAVVGLPAAPTDVVAGSGRLLPDARARQAEVAGGLALGMLRAGRDPAAVQRWLVARRIPPPLAHGAVRWATSRLQSAAEPIARAAVSPVVMSSAAAAAPRSPHPLTFQAPGDEDPEAA
jgi:hypothetical protein